MPQKVMRMSVFASLMQRYDFFRNCASKIQNIFTMERKKILSHFPTFPLSHFGHLHSEKFETEILHYIYNIVYYIYNVILIIMRYSIFSLF